MGQERILSCFFFSCSVGMWTWWPDLRQPFGIVRSVLGAQSQDGSSLERTVIFCCTERLEGLNLDPDCVFQVVYLVGPDTVECHTTLNTLLLSYIVGREK